MAGKSAKCVKERGCEYAGANPQSPIPKKNLLLIYFYLKFLNNNLIY